MDAWNGRRRLLLPALGLMLLLAPLTLRAESVLHVPPDYQPVPAMRRSVEVSAVPVLLTTLFGVPPIVTIREEVAPPTPPTLVVASPPTNVPPWGGITTPGFPEAPGTQTYLPWTPTTTDPGIVNINKVPEPTSMVSGLLGLGIVLFRRRIRVRTRKSEPASFPSTTL